jgi:hypothetical protein
VNAGSLLPEQRKRLIEILNIIRPAGRQVRFFLLQLTSGRIPAAVDAHSNSIQPALQILAPPLATTSQPSPPKSAVIPPMIVRLAPANSIVTQIDTIPQALGQNSARRARHLLTQSPEGSADCPCWLDVTTELMKFDPRSAAIRGAITEWENKYTPIVVSLVVR